MINNIPKVAIVGRPNVGKSSLVNRICKNNEAIVHKEPMITRDRKYYLTDWNGREFYLLDTGGIDLRSTEKLDALVFHQTKIAINESDIIIFLIDLKEPVSVLDEEIVTILRKTEKKIIFAGNKWDSKRGDYFLEDYLKFGFGYPIKISAVHGINIGDLLDEVVSSFAAASSAPEEVNDKEPSGIAILGKPNVGKSTLFNTMINEERAIVNEVEGTTRDTIDSIVTINEKEYKFIDTAGIRSKKIKTEDLEFYSSIRTFKAIESSDIALLLIDCTDEVTKQDLKIVEMVIEKGISICVVFNKVDLVSSDKMAELIEVFEERLRFASYIPFLKVSALTKKGIKKIIKIIDVLIEERKKVIPDSKLTNLFKKLQQKGGVYSKGKQFKVKFIRQIKPSPPFFLVFSNLDVGRKTSIRRYVENNIRREFGFQGTPMYFKFKH